MEDIDLAILKAKYSDAVEKGESSFTLYGAEILVSYAKYLIEYQDSIAR